MNWFERYFIFLHPITNTWNSFWGMKLWNFAMLLALFSAFETLFLMAFFATANCDCVAFALAGAELANAILIIGYTRHYLCLQLFYCAVQNIISMVKFTAFGVAWMVLNMLHFAGVTLNNDIFYPDLLRAHPGLGIGLGAFFILESLFNVFQIGVVYQSHRILREVYRQLDESAQLRSESARSAERRTECGRVSEDELRTRVDMVRPELGTANFDTYYEETRRGSWT